MTNPPTTPLTALERELLASVERLVTACESSAKELRALGHILSRQNDANY